MISKWLFRTLPVSVCPADEHLLPRATGPAAASRPCHALVVWSAKEWATSTQNNSSSSNIPVVREDIRAESRWRRKIIENRNFAHTRVIYLCPINPSTNVFFFCQIFCQRLFYWRIFGPREYPNSRRKKQNKTPCANGPTGVHRTPVVWNTSGTISKKRRVRLTWAFVRKTCVNCVLSCNYLVSVYDRLMAIIDSISAQRSQIVE